MIKTIDSKNTIETNHSHACNLNKIAKSIIIKSLLYKNTFQYIKTNKSKVKYDT